MTKAVSPRAEKLSSPAKQNWYLGRDGKQQGPFAFAEIVSFAGNETIDADDLLWRPGLRQWIPANSVSGLLSPPPLPESIGVSAGPKMPPPLPLDMRGAIETTVFAPAARHEPLVAQNPARFGESAETTAAPDEKPAAESAPHEPTEASAVDSDSLDIPPAGAIDAPVAAASDVPSDAPFAPEASDDHGDPLDHEREQLRGLVSEILEPSEPQASYVVRHWRGELSFTKSLFVNGILLTAAMGGIYAALVLLGPDVMKTLAQRLATFGWEFPQLSTMLENPPAWLRIPAIIGPWLAAGGVYIWSLVGIFRSAINRL
jgi:GYF domain 2